MDGGMAENYGAPEAGQLPKAWQTARFARILLDPGKIEARARAN